MSLNDTERQELETLRNAAAQAAETGSNVQKNALVHVAELKLFYVHSMLFAACVCCLLVLNYLTSPAYYWVIWVAVFWGSTVGFHGVLVFGKNWLFGPAWEKRQVEKYLASR